MKKDTFEDFNDTQSVIYELFMNLLYDISQILLTAEDEDPDTGTQLFLFAFFIGFSSHFFLICVYLKSIYVFKIDAYIF
jgi:hypothetical protein